MLYRNQSQAYSPDTIHLRLPGKSLSRQLKRMCSKSENQIWVSNKNVKLYCPPVYQHLARISKIKKDSHHTLCCALQIYQNYWHTLGHQAYLLKPCHKVIAELCLDISEDINETKPELNKKKQDCRRKQNMIEKLQILQKLKWEVNYITFINICNLLMDWLQGQLKQKNLIYNFKHSLENQTEIMIEQFNFLTLSPIQSASRVIRRVFNHFQLQVKSDIQSILMGKAQSIQLKKMTIKQPIRSQLEQIQRVQDERRRKIGKSWAQILKFNFIPLQPSIKQTQNHTKDTMFEMEHFKAGKSKLAQLRKKIIEGNKKHSLCYQPCNTIELGDSKQNCTFSTRTSIEQ